MIGRRVAGLAAIVSEMAPELIDELNESRNSVVFLRRRHAASQHYQTSG